MKLIQGKLVTYGNILVKYLRPRGTAKCPQPPAPLPHKDNPTHRAVPQGSIQSAFYVQKPLGAPLEGLELFNPNHWLYVESPSDSPTMHQVLSLELF